MFVLIFVSIIALCGSTPVDTEVNLGIVGGTPYAIATVPYQAGLEYKKDLICGATIISNFYLLTAAHCKLSTVLSDFQIRVGTSTAELNGAVYNVKEFGIHRNYNPVTYKNDIAYIKTTMAMTFNANVQKATLFGSALTSTSTSTSNSSLGCFTTSEPLLITGWGRTSTGGTASPILLGAVINFVNLATCQLKYRPTIIFPGMFCAAAAGKDACQGDSGGPIVLNKNKVLVGVTSFGRGCANPAFPGVYATIIYYRPWIKSKTGV